jgi:prepilin-type N-terminal cleavage/methylation domain-containing protein
VARSAEPAFSSPPAQFAISSAMKARNNSFSSQGFTFIEALMTIAILGVMAAILVSAFSSTSTDANRMIARQQQAAIQNAVNSWVNGDSNRVNVLNAATGAAKPRTVEEIRTDYNSRQTGLARLNLVSGYLDERSLEHFDDHTINNNIIKSEALSAIRQHITMSDWTTTTGYPQVLLNAD